ncbi:MAG: hypothetical protein PHO23_00185 [Candidatus Pacebacteria bacterium]|nr:hypothetical protein [Candidatus Paceibacterota bacterium]
MNNFENQGSAGEETIQKQIQDSARLHIDPEKIAYDEGSIDENTMAVIMDVMPENYQVLEKLGPNSLIDGNVLLADIPDLQLEQNTIYTKNVNLIRCDGLEAIPEGSVFAKVDKNDRTSYILNIQKCKNLKQLASRSMFDYKVTVSDCPSLTSLGQNNIFQDMVKISNCSEMREIEDNTTFRSSVILENLDNFESIGDNISLSGGIEVSNCPNLKSIDKHIRLGDKVVIKNCPNLTNISQDVIFTEGTSIEIDNIDQFNSQTKEMLQALETKGLIQII